MGIFALQGGEDVKAEVQDLFSLLDTVLRKYDDLTTRVEELSEDLEDEAKRAEREKKRREEAMDQLGIDSGDERE